MASHRRGHARPRPPDMAAWPLPRQTRPRRP